MPYRFVDHTAELELALEAPSREAVLAEAVRALGELLGGDTPPGGAVTRREVSVEAGDEPALLAAWLEEIVFVAENESLVPRHVVSLEAGARTAHGLVAFAEGAPPHLVKGVTYHHLELGRHGAVWRGRVVLDV